MIATPLLDLCLPARSLSDARNAASWMLYDVTSGCSVAFTCTPGGGNGALPARYTHEESQDTRSFFHGRHSPPLVTFKPSVVELRGGYKASEDPCHAVSHAFVLIRPQFGAAHPPPFNLPSRVSRNSVDLSISTS